MDVMLDGGKTEIEIARDRYMHEGRIERSPAFDQLQQAMTRFIAALATRMDLLAAS